jgi:hypothetical protein
VIEIRTATEDAFANWVAKIVSGSAVIYEPPAVHVVELDHWFDQKWLRFSGKSLGAVGWWKDDLTIPPFHPNRVRSERHYKYHDTEFEFIVGDSPRLHLHQPSSNNLQRRLRTLAPSTACFWYSSDGTKVGRGALMAYLPFGASPTAWYVGAEFRKTDWLPKVRSGITSTELARLEEAGTRSAVEQ